MKSYWDHLRRELTLHGVWEVFPSSEIDFLFRESRNSAFERKPPKLSSLDEFFRRGVLGSRSDDNNNNKDNNNRSADDEPFKVSDVLKTKNDRFSLRPKEQKLLHK